MVVFVDYENNAFDESHQPDHPGAPLHSFIDSENLLIHKLVIGGPPPSDIFPTKNNNHDQSRDIITKRTVGGTATESASSTAESTSTTDCANAKRSNPNRNAFSAALSCYPVVKELARSVDLNTLHALSRTCRQFRANLMPFCQQLIRQTLRCENEYIETLSDVLDHGSSVPDSVKSVLALMNREGIQPGRLTRTKIRKCARDMVGECRRCSRVVCRNCTVKPPSDSMLKNRLRRLCTTCRTVPLAYHYSLSRPNDASLDLNKENVSFTASAFARTPCSCEEAVWLCYKCGQTLRSNDTTYRRVWTWRTRYSTYLDGNLGTGIGEGCQGVKCGRGEYCLAAQEIELEVDPEADDGLLTDAIHHHITINNNSSNSYPLGHAGAAANSGAPLLVDLRDEEEPGYFRQEMVGVGGVVKHKAKKRVMVGACVIEFEDERDTGQYLVREEEGLHRGWCAWCWRVVPARQESDRA